MEARVTGDTPKVTIGLVGGKTCQKKRGSGTKTVGIIGANQEKQLRRNLLTNKAEIGIPMTTSAG